MATVVWNPILVPSTERWNANKGASKGGGRSITNQEQVIAGPSGYATASMTIPVNTREKVLAMRAMLASLDGRAGTLLVGPCEGHRVPWFVDPLTGGAIVTSQGDRDAARDPAWDANADTSADLDFRLFANAAMNVTQVTIQRVRGGLLIPGMLFGIGQRLHILAALTGPDPVDAGGLAAPGTVGAVIRPWLRGDYPAGTALEFAKPRCLMRRASDDDAEIELQLSRFGTVILDLVEAF
ncbi:hypothetical protein [Methylobacterium sp. E-045]|uniref:hypothetical protein n=1 Tax=Methylobacterium sp. E-045 TaxID=2836575 RepID=UPI001FBBD773|nr:hypothetical protein [Methylobacterium sp. E-045]MCJ2132445.1 hypothetical protein [Methylobacterium sp. E-045]